MIPLGQLAKVSLSKGAPAVRTENAQLVAYIYVDIRDRDIGGYVRDAQKAVREQVNFLPGYTIQWSGQFEYMERATEKLKLVVPLTLVIIFLLLYLNFRRMTETLIVMLSVPFALVGGVWLLWWLDYNLSVAVAVGFIALAGVAAETGVVMLIYLEQRAGEDPRGARRGRQAADTAGPLRGDDRRRRGTGAAEDDDGGRDHRGPAADHVGHGNRQRGDAAHRRTDGGRHDLLDRAHAGRHPGHLHAGQDTAGGPRRAVTHACTIRPVNRFLDPSIYWGDARRAYLVIGLVPFGLIGVGMFLQHVIGLDPCPLCIFQRIAYFFVGVFGLLAAALAPRGRPAVPPY